MTTTAGLVHDPSLTDVYDPDGVFPQNSPILKPHHPNLQPSSSPPPDLPQVSPPPSPGHKSSNRRRKVPGSRGDAILIQMLDGGRRPEIAHVAGQVPLVEYVDEEEEDSCTSSSGDGSDDDLDNLTMSPMVSPRPRPAEPAAVTSPGPIDHLKSMAALAVAAFSASAPLPTLTDEASETDGGQEDTEMAEDVTSPQPQPRAAPEPQQQQRQVIFQKSVLQAPITPHTPNHPMPDVFSPGQSTSSQVLRHPNDVKSSAGVPAGVPNGHGELAPIQIMSPISDTSGHGPLPSIRSTLGDELTHSNRHTHPTFPHSPPGGATRIPIITGSHASPPISPHNIYNQSMPSPASLPILSPYYYPSSSSNTARSLADYSSSNTETPGTEPASTPTTATSITDRMSIDNMTNPQNSNFVCEFPGCTASPFATQYLLNSHANVHSSARPHYCSVKGCPRAEGGKGFKRKNEMIRHGLVHDSPGYVCPFCPDREHKYPRPDNLQRHVRVHHVDKDKDDPLLRGVLAQRPDGPNRGRRRRGAP